jgi:hypothetical protein
MKTMRAVRFGFGMLALLALATTFASAGDSDCATMASACGFGVLQGGDTKVGILTGNGHVVPFVENVYLSASGVYTYVFQITNGAGGALDFANAFTTAGGGGLGDNFNCGNGSCLNFGVVFGGISLATSVDDNPEGLGFHFNPLSLTVDFGILTSGQSFTFYAQGGPPVTGTLNAGNGGSTTNSNNILAPASEPSVVALLGSSLLLFGGILFAGRFRSREP